MPSAPFHTGVSLRSFHFEDFMFTVNLATGITVADVGKALALDPTGTCKFKLAGDGDIIVARLEVVENRLQEGQLVGTAAFRWSNLMPIKAASGVAVGNTVVGAGNGEIKPSGAAAAPHTNFVSEIVGNYAVVSRL